MEEPIDGQLFIGLMSGSSCDGHKLRMKATPQVVVEGSEVRLVAPQAKLDA